MTTYPVIEMPEYFLSLPEQDRRHWKLKDAQKFSLWLIDEIPQRVSYLSTFAHETGNVLELTENSIADLIDSALKSGKFTKIHEDGQPVLNIFGISLLTDVYLYFLQNLISRYGEIISLEPYRYRKTDFLQNIPTLKFCGNLSEYHIFDRVSALGLQIVRYNATSSIYFKEYEKICSDIERLCKRK